MTLSIEGTIEVIPGVMVYVSLIAIFLSVETIVSEQVEPNFDLDLNKLILQGESAKQPSLRSKSTLMPSSNEKGYDLPAYICHAFVIVDSVQSQSNRFMEMPGQFHFCISMLSPPTEARYNAHPIGYSSRSVQHIVCVRLSILMSMGSGKSLNTSRISGRFSVVSPGG